MALSDREKLNVLLKDVMNRMADDLEKSILVTPSLSKPIGYGLVIPGKEEFIAVLEYEQSLPETPELFYLNIGVRRRDNDRLIRNYGYFEGKHQEFIDYVRIPTCDYAKLCDQIMVLYERLESYY